MRLTNTVPSNRGVSFLCIYMYSLVYFSCSTVHEILGLKQFHGRHVGYVIKANKQPNKHSDRNATIRSYSSLRWSEWKSIRVSVVKMPSHHRSEEQCQFVENLKYSRAIENTKFASKIVSQNFHRHVQSKKCTSLLKLMAFYSSDYIIIYTDKIFHHLLSLEDDHNH